MQKLLSKHIMMTWNNVTLLGYGLLTTTVASNTTKKTHQHQEQLQNVGNGGSNSGHNDSQGDNNQSMQGVA